MKSVVVEGSTVAKAIELAWLKAEKPEEFFIRVLQEHSSGFLGFGGQKAKVVLFFKNNHKSDSLFPTVLKQKEYSNFFDNKNLKNPTELDYVDTQLNKNAIAGTPQNGQKKKHGQQNHQVKTAEQVTQAQGQQKNKPAQIPVQVHAKPAQQAQQKPVVLQKIATHNNQGHQVKQVKVGQPVQEKNQKQSLQVSLQAPTQQPVTHKKPVQKVEDRQDVAHDVANVLKKVQSQKIVANVSRNGADKPLQKPVHKHQTEKVKVVTPKFESYAEFMDAQADKAAAKVQSAFEAIEKISAPVHAFNSTQKTLSDVLPEIEKIAEKEILKPVDSILAKIESLPADIVVSKPVVVVHQELPAAQPSAPTGEKRPFIKMKRRPLSTDNPGVSGITRSSDVKKVEDNAQQSQDTSVQKNDND